MKLVFLNEVLKEDVYVQQPPGFIIHKQEDKVYKLKRSLYELK